MDYKIIDREHYYRKGVYRHFTEDCKCSTSMTARVDVTDLVSRSKETGTKFYINFLYILTKVLNSRDDYRMQYLWQSDELVCYNVINPTPRPVRLSTRPITRTTRSSTRMLQLISSARKPPANTFSMPQAIRTGSTHPTSHGCLMTP